MKGLNEVKLLGNVGQAPEMKYSPSVLNNIVNDIFQKDFTESKMSYKDYWRTL